MKRLLDGRRNQKANVKNVLYVSAETKGRPRALG